MIAKLFDLVFGCRHTRITRPITPVYRYHSQLVHSYVTCLECGKQFYYDTRNLRMGAPVPQPAITPHHRSSSFQAQY